MQQKVAIINMHDSLPPTEMIDQMQVGIGEAFIIPGVNGYAPWLSNCIPITRDGCKFQV